MENDVKDSDYLKNLGPLLEDYAQWFGELVTCIAFPQQANFKIEIPSSYEIWARDTEESEAISPTTLRGLTDSYEHMMMEGRAILDVLSDGGAIQFESFNNFKERYDTFFRQIRRVEHDSVMEESGLDEQTGLRSAKVIADDMKREMERLDRQGTAFCQVMIRIDHFARYDQHDEVLNMTVESIRNAIRPFDDAYYLGKGHFLVSMKQTDIIGSEAGFNRIRLELSERKENTDNVTLSACLMEPAVGDEADKMLRNLRQDLDENENAKDVILKFKEISELERFVGNMK